MGLKAKTSNFLNLSVFFGKMGMKYLTGFVLKVNLQRVRG